MLTPQEIKSQEFGVKFRGYEPSEVHTYLEQLSENFSELNSQISSQVKEIWDLKGELKSLASEKEALAEELKAVQDEQAESSNNEDEINFASERVVEPQNILEIEKLRTKVAMLEEMNSALRQEEIDFKTTITAAQHFSNTLKEASEAEAAKLKEESEARAAELKAATEAEAAEQVDNLRNEMTNFKKQSEQELTQLLTEINTLKTQKEQVKGELKNTLYFYLNALDGDTSEKSLEDSASLESLELLDSSEPLASSESLASLESIQQLEVTHEAEVEA